MGYTTVFGMERKQDMIEYIKMTYGDRLDVMRVVGNNIWGIHKDNDGKRLIVLFRLSKYDGDFGYNLFTECAGPVFYDCPLSLLKQVDEPQNDYARKWRDTIQHINKRMKALKSGAMIDLFGKKYELTVRCHGGWHGRNENNNEVYRLRTKDLRFKFANEVS